MPSGTKFKKRVVAVFLLGALASTTLLCSDKLKPHQSPATDSSQPDAAPPELSPAQKPAAPGSPGKPDSKPVQPAPANPSLNLQLPKQDATLTESDIVLPDSPHNIKNLLSDTQKKSESPISVSGSVFLDEEEKKAPVPNTRVIDQLNGGEVKVKVKTK